MLGQVSFVEEDLEIEWCELSDATRSMTLRRFPKLKRGSTVRQCSKLIDEKQKQLGIFVKHGEQDWKNRINAVGSTASGIDPKLEELGAASTSSTSTSTSKSA